MNAIISLGSVCSRKRQKINVNLILTGFILLNKPNLRSKGLTPVPDGGRTISVRGLPWAITSEMTYYVSGGALNSTHSLMWAMYTFIANVKY